jgi:hypothetical protein
MIFQSLTVALSNAVPGRSADITTVADKVEGTIAQAISGYQGI